VGIDARTLDALAEYEASPAFTPRERAALAYADAVVRRDAEVSEACFASAFAKGLGVVPQGLAA
jgi:alkylhydroperoxidase family enzyme